MADVRIEATTSDKLDSQSVRGGPFWTTPLIGYVIYPNSDSDLVYRKTTDGGANWGIVTQIVVPGSCDVLVYDCYADWQTAGDAGTKIHIDYISLDTNEVRHVCLDTNDDSVGGDDLIETCQGTGTFRFTVNFSIHLISVTKTRGGNLAVVFKYQDDTNAQFDGFYTSPDATTWTSRTTPYEISEDYCLLFPGNEADNQDVWATFWDKDVDEISLKTFDNSGNSWSEQVISAGMEDNPNYPLMDGQIRLSDGHLIFAAWSQYDNVASDLKVWDINGAGSITAKANVITDEAENFAVSVFVDQISDNLYITYVQGTTAQSLVKCVYQKSTNGGTSWDGETAMQADAEDDERWVSAGAMKAVWGGKFQPVWFDDDDNELFTNSDNGISIVVGWAGGNVSGVAIGSIAKINGIALADIVKVNGIA